MGRVTLAFLQVVLLQVTLATTLSGGSCPQSKRQELSSEETGFIAQDVIHFYLESQFWGMPEKNSFLPRPRGNLKAIIAFRPPEAIPGENAAQANILVIVPGLQSTFYYQQIGCLIRREEGPIYDAYSPPSGTTYLARMKSKYKQFFERATQVQNLVLDFPSASSHMDFGPLDAWKQSVIDHIAQACHDYLLANRAHWEKKGIPVSQLRLTKIVIGEFSRWSHVSRVFVPEFHAVLFVALDSPNITNPVTVWKSEDEDEIRSDLLKRIGKHSISAYVSFGDKELGR